MEDINLLNIKNLHTCYGEAEIIKGIDLQINRGEIVTLLGRNGAGKTTTIKTIMGLIHPRMGDIIFDGKNIVGLKPHEIACLGIGYVPENRIIFPSLTVLENLNLSVTRKKREGWDLEKIFEYFPILKERRKHKGFELSGGEQQMLAIARILRTQNLLILLDEPTQGLAPMLVQSIENILRGIKHHRITLLLVEQNIRFAQVIGERHYIISNGEIVYIGTSQEFIQNDVIKKRYLGV